MTSWKPDAYDRQRRGETQVIEARCPGWVVVYGWHSRAFWAFGAPDGKPVTARSASELLGRMRAAEREQAGSYQESRPPRHY